MNKCICRVRLEFRTGERCGLAKIATAISSSIVGLQGLKLPPSFVASTTLDYKAGTFSVALVGVDAHGSTPEECAESYVRFFSDLILFPVTISATTEAL